MDDNSVIKRIVKDGKVYYRLPGPDLTPEKEAELREVIKKCLIPIEYKGIVLTEMCNGDYLPFQDLFSDEEKAYIIIDFFKDHSDRDTIEECVADLDERLGTKKRMQELEWYIIERTRPRLERWAKQNADSF